MTDKISHSASQLVEFITAHALLVTADDALDRARVSCSDDALEVVFPRVVGSDHGDEGLRMTFPISSPRGCKHVIHRQGLERFVNPADSTDEAIAARDPNPPFVEHLATFTFKPGDETIPADLGELAQGEWAEYIESYLRANKAVQVSMPHVCDFSRSFCDEGELEGADELLSEPTRYFHWSRHDQHYVAEYDGAGAITVSAINFDDYYPSDAHELAEMVDQELEAWFAEARKVEYRYNPSIGWEYRRGSDHDWETVCDA